MKDWMEDGYELGDTRSRTERRADRQAEMAATGMSWKATRRRRS